MVNSCWGGLGCEDWGEETLLCIKNTLYVPTCLALLRQREESDIGCLNVFGCAVL